MTQSRGERNNNSGNIEDGPWARSQPGYAGSDGRFARFNDPSAGDNAQVKLIRDGKRYKGKSIAGVLQVYAPLGDNSEASLRNYIGYVAARAGINPDHPIPAGAHSRVAAAMREFETGRTQRGTKFTGYQGALSGGGKATPRSRPQGGQITQPGMIQMPSINDVRSTKATRGESARSDAPREYAVINPDDATNRARTAAEGARSATDNYLASVNAALETNRTQQAAEVEALKQRNAERKGVRNQIVDGTQRLIQASTPIFQKRRAISDRIGEIAEMSPFERMIRGTFDPNYNETSLNARDKRYSQQLSSLADEYEYTSKLQNALMSQIDDEYQSGRNLSDLQRQGMMQDLQLMGMSVGASQGVLAQVMDEIRADNTIEQAKNYAISDTVSKLSLGQLNEAEQSSVDGITVINGLEIPTQMITDRLDTLQQHEYDMASREMALQGQNLNLAEAAEDRIISRLSAAEVTAAIQNDGKIGSQSFAIPKLLAHQATLAQGRQNQAAEAAMSQAPDVAGYMWRGLAQSHTNAAHRIASLGGGNDQGFQALSARVTSEAKLFAEGSRAARAGGYLDEYVAQELPKIQKLYQDQSAYIDEYAKKWAGGNKSLHVLGTAWLSGQPLNANDSVKALLTMARDGLPAGTRLSGAPLSAYNAAVAVYKESITPQANDPANPFAPAKKKAAGFDEEMIAKAAAKIRSTYEGALTNELIHAAPAIARNIKGSNGQSHAFNRIDPRDYAAAISASDEAGEEQIAMDLGFKSAAEFKQVFRNPAKWNQLAAGRPEMDRGTVGKQLALLQTQLLFKYLDASPSARDGFKPSEAFVSLMSSAEFQRAAVKAAELQRHQNPGAYAIGHAAGDSPGARFIEYANMIPRAHVKAREQKLKTKTAEAQEYLANPIKRAGIILSGTDLSPGEQKLLLEAVRTKAGLESGSFASAINTGHDFVGSDSESGYWPLFNDAMLNQKFDDPKIESLRRRAAKDWQRMAPKSKSMIEQIFGFGG